MKYFLAYFSKYGSETSFYELIYAGNMLQAKSIAEREHPDGYLIEVNEALTR